MSWGWGMSGLEEEWLMLRLWYWGRAGIHLYMSYLSFFLGGGGAVFEGNNGLFSKEAWLGLWWDGMGLEFDMDVV